MLLECLPAPKLFHLFLQARVDAAVSALSGQSSVIESLAGFVRSCCLTLHLADALFCSQQASTAGGQMTTTPCALLMLARPFCSAETPPDVMAVLREAGVSHSTSLLPLDDVKAACEAWMSKIVAVSAPLITEQLARVLSAQDLASVAQSLGAKLASPCGDTHGIASWRQVCVRVLGADFDTWANFFDAPFALRAHRIIS
jgi:hypothetical protein